MSNVYRNIKRIREEKGMSQDELAHLVGFKSRSSINKIESGKNDITQSKLAAIARALNVSIDYLLGNCTEPQHKYVIPKVSDDAKPIDGLVKELFADNPKVLDLLRNGVYSKSNKFVGKSLAELSPESKKHLRDTILLLLKANGYDVDDKPPLE